MKRKDEAVVMDGRRRNHRGQMVGGPGPALAAHRGWQVGVHDAYKAIRRKYPEAAKAILARYGMDTKGNILLSEEDS